MFVDINLLPEKIRERSTLLWIAIAIFIVSLFVFITFYWMAQKSNDEAKLLNQQAYEVQKQQEDISSQLRPSTFSQEKSSLASTVEFLESYQFKTYPLINDLIRALPERGFFLELTFTAPNIVMLTVQFDDLTEPAHYLTRIKASNLIIDATFEGLEANELNDDRLKNVLPRYVANYFIRFVDERSDTKTDEIPDSKAVEVPTNEPQPPPDTTKEGGVINE